MPTLKIDHARFILTLDPERRIIRDGSILIDGARIVRIGKAAELAAERADRVIDAREMVVTPGFVNLHMHISYAHATRGVWADDLGTRYLPNVFRLQSVMTPEEEAATSLLALTELVMYGTTTIVDPGSTKHIAACLPAYERAGARIVTGVHVTDRPNPLNLPVYDTDTALRLIEEAITTHHGALDGRVHAWAMPFSAAFATPELLRGAKELAGRHGTGLTLHHTNNAQSIEASLAATGRYPTEVLGDLGVLGPNVLLSHGLGLHEREIDVIARTNTRVAAVPTAALKAGNGAGATMPLPELLARGVAVGLGTDAANNSNLVETLRSVYLAAVLWKDARRDVTAIPAETALELGTILGARALGLDAEIGSLEPGKRADIVLFTTRRPEWQTLYNPVNNLVYSADGRSVHTVVIDGRVVVENHTPLFADPWELARQVQAIGESMLARTGIEVPMRWPVV